jgi:hypothetical protein
MSTLYTQAAGLMRFGLAYSLMGGGEDVDFLAQWVTSVFKRGAARSLLALTPSSFALRSEKPGCRSQGLPSTTRYCLGLTRLPRYYKIIGGLKVVSVPLSQLYGVQRQEDRRREIVDLGTYFPGRHCHH